MVTVTQENQIKFCKKFRKILEIKNSIENESSKHILEKKMTKWFKRQKLSESYVVFNLIWFLEYNKKL